MVMTSKSTAKIIGVLFLVSTVAYLTGSGLVDAVLNEPAFLSQLYPDRMKVLVGLFLKFINAAAVIGIAVLLFPILKPYSEFIAFGYLSSRIIESMLLLVGILAPLTLIALSEGFIAEGSEAEGYFQTIADLLLRGEDMAFQLAMLVLGLGSMMLCILLYRTQLVPRMLALLGIAGYIALTASSCFTMIGYDPGAVLFIPGGLFELILPVWLIIKGFAETRS